MRHLLAFLFFASVCFSADALPAQPKTPPPDDRFKADILLIVAHPDDETAIGNYLPRAIFDQHKRVAVIFGTRGNGGGNSMGLEQAAALGTIREIEARKALAYWGVMNVWFLGGPDTPGQDVLRSLETWNHGNALWQAVRIVRLTRPQVIITWLPAYVAGENHGDHQASAVIATEAFDMAGDPTVFPEQVAPPRDRDNIGNLTEGLRPWQTQKLYFFSDAARVDFMKGRGPEYSGTDVSPARNVPYYRLAMEEMSFHLTQGDSGQVAKEALEKGDFKVFMDPSRLIFGKSIVSGSVTGDIFEGVVPGPVPFARVGGYEPHEQPGVSAEFGGPWAYYLQFRKAHGIADVALPAQPEVSVDPSSRLSVPVLIHNRTSENREASVTVTTPSGWNVERGPGRYSAAAGESVPIEFFLKAPSKLDADGQIVTVNVAVPGQSLIALPLKVTITNGNLPQ
jgi:LmbE family N-acetylglucosaminyl deacetylase